MTISTKYVYRLTATCLFLFSVTLSQMVSACDSCGDKCYTMNAQGSCYSNNNNVSDCSDALCKPTQSNGQDDGLTWQASKKD